MDKVISLRNSKFLKEESQQEFYLNPKDMLINGKIYDAYNRIDFLHYLPINELLIILHEESIIIVDIKKSLSGDLKMVKVINHAKLHQTIFKHEKTEEDNEGDISPTAEKKNKQSAAKGKNTGDTSNTTTTTNTTSTTTSSKIKFEGFCFKIKECDESKIKNFTCFEKRSFSNSICLLIEYMNMDFLMLKYECLSNDDFQVVVKLTKEDFIEYINKKNLKKIDENLFRSISIKNYDTQIKPIQLSSDICTDCHKNSIYLIAYKIHMNIYLANYFDCPGSNKNFTFDFSFQLGQEVKDFTCLVRNQQLFIVSVSQNDQIFIDRFTIGYEGKVNRFKCIFQNHQLIENGAGNVSVIKLENLSDMGVTLIYSQLGKVFIYTAEDGTSKFCLYHIYRFEKFAESPIRYAHVLDNYLFAFTINGEYAYQSLFIDSSSNSSETISSSEIYSLSLSKQIFGMSKFSNNCGLFIISTHNAFKISNFNILYFIPNIISSQFNSSFISHSVTKTYKELSSIPIDKNIKSFFSYGLGEYMILYLRFRNHINSFLLSGEDYAKSNFGFFQNDVGLLVQRLQHCGKFFKMQSENLLATSLQFYEKKILIGKFRMIFERKNDTRMDIENDNDNVNVNDNVNDKIYSQYLQTSSYVCEFCSKMLDKFNEETNYYLCEGKHIINACCVTYTPLLEISENYNKFLYCDDCEIFYSLDYSKINFFPKHFENCTCNLLSLSICLVCQKMLSKT